MKTKLCFIYLLIIMQSSWGQNCNFEIRNLSNQLKVSFEIVNEFAHENVPIEPYVEFSPLSELVLLKEYPEIFTRKDSCLIYKSDTKETSLCNKNVQSKEYFSYEVKGNYCGYALIKTTGYETWGFVSIDLKNGTSFYTLGKPLTLVGETSISYSNYYGEEEIALTDLKTKKQYVIGIEGWRTIQSKAYSNTYYLKLVSGFQEDCEKEMKYLKIALKDN